MIEYVVPSEIEKRSFEIIEAELKARNIILPEDEKPVTMRVIHASADFDYAAAMRYSPDAVASARALLIEGADIVTDTNMAKAGISKKTLERFGGEVHCFMADEDVAEEAKQRDCAYFALRNDGAGHFYAALRNRRAGRLCEC